MPQLLQGLIERSMETANKRNLAVENPITMMIEVTSSDSPFYIVVSYREPNHVTLPFNVTWIVADPTNLHYMKALRRASALPYESFRNTWVELRTYQDFLDELQFWDISSSFQTGEVQTSGVREATVMARGLFALHQDALDPANPVVVGDNDPRMFDARQPLPHVHPQLPATMLKGSVGINAYYVTVSLGIPPEIGQILVLSEQGDQPGEYNGYWRWPVAADVVYAGPQFISLVINGPVGNRLDELTAFPFTASAYFDDGSILSSVPAMWDVIANPAGGTIASSTGAFISNDITGEQIVRIRATWVHPESRRQQTGTYDLTLNDLTVTAHLTSLEIVKEVDSLNEGGNTALYSVKAHYADGTSRGVVPASFISSNASSGVLSANTGIFTAAQNVNQNEVTTLTATYTENGITKTASVTLTVVDTTIYPISAEVQGPTVVAENSVSTYVLVVTFSDQTTSQVAVSNWLMNNPAAGTINASSGQLITPTNLNANETARVTASFVSNGRTVSAFKDITARDTSVYPLSARILGPTQVGEGGTQLYQLEVTFSDSTVQTVNSTSWSSSITGVATINATSGQLTTAADLASNQSTTISAGFSQSGQNVTASMLVTIVDTTNYPVSAQIIGNASMPEGSAHQSLKLRVTYLDGTHKDVTAVWASTNPGVATVDATGYVTSAANLIGNGATIISATYSEKGVDFAEMLTLTVTDETVYPVSARIVGPSTVSENTTVSYVLEVTFDDNSVANRLVSTFSSSNSNAGTITSTGQFTAPGTMIADASTTISASYTLDGHVVNATLPVTVTDDTIYPASATIIGSASVNEQTTATYYLEVTYTDATKRTVSPTNWSSSNTSVATINANSGLLTSLQVSSDSTTTIQASYTEQGQTVSASLAILVRDTTVYPVSAVVVGPATINENSSETYHLSVTFTDSTSSTVPITTWASSNSNAGVINPSTGLFQAATNVAADVNTTVSCSYTSNGRTVSANKQISVLDVTAYPVSATIVGPATLNENTQATYVLRVTFDDSSVSDVVATNWAISNANAGVIVAATGLFTAANNATGSNITGTITASYTLDGATASGSLQIGVVDTTLAAKSAEIVTVPAGLTSVNESGTIQYKLRVTYSDNSTSDQTPTWTSDNADAGSINSAGLYTASSDIVGNKAVVVSGSFTDIQGNTVGDTIALTVIDTIHYPVSLTINGPSQVNEGSNQAYTLTVTYDTGASATVTSTSWASSLPLAGSINATTGIFTPANVTSDQSTRLSATHTAHGRTVSATLDVTVKYVRAVSSAAVIGAATANEGGVIQYSLEVTFDDGSKETKPVTNWTSTNINAGVMSNTGQFTAVSNVTANVTTTISANYSENGQTVTGSRSITVLNTQNLPISATILGVSTLNEGTSTTYQLRVSFEDGTNAVKSVTTWARSNAAAGSIDSAGVFTAANVTANQTTNITASYTEYGQTVTATALPLTVVYVGVASAVIIGSTTVAELGTSTYQFRVTYADTTTAIKSISNWAYNDPTGGSINATTGVFTALEVAANRAGRITGSYTENGDTVSAYLDITVSNSAVVGAGMPRWGYGPFSGPHQTENGFTSAQQLVESLTGLTILPSTNDDEMLNIQLPDANTYAYFLCPVSLGTVNFLDTLSMFTGGWDGSTWSFDPFADGSFMNMGPALITYNDGTGPAQWALYRTDYTGPWNPAIPWRISYS